MPANAPAQKPPDPHGSQLSSQAALSRTPGQAPAPPWIWFLWLLGFYAAWLWLVWGLGWWPVAQEHWPIALAMAVGGYAAGATPMGGGTVGFPVLVLLFEMPASLGRDFSFAVQSIGMVSASIFILARRQPLAQALLVGTLAGSALGTPLGIFLIAPFLPELWIKVVFAVIWGSFGILHLYRIREISAHSGMVEFHEGWNFRLGFVLGLLSGSTVVAVTGVGIDMVVYCALVLVCRADLKIAIPTSILIMAFNSLYGVALKSLTTGLQAGVFENWLAAAPVVALSAPLGVFVVAWINRTCTLLFVALLCVGQFLWTCAAEFSALGWTGVVLSCAAVLAVLLIFERLRTLGAVLAGECDLHGHHRSSLGYRAVEPHVGSTPKDKSGEALETQRGISSIK